jgi:uncharacterized SAM-binding protein YcdF (DUF218 family)
MENSYARARRWVVIMGAAFAVPALVVVLAGLADSAEVSDLCVVPANKVETDGRPSPRLAARLDQAFEVYRAGLASVLFVSGGTGVEGWDEAQVMQRVLVARGVPAERIVVDSDGYDTYKTAAHAAAYMRAHGMNSAIVVSNYYHILRTKLALRWFGVPWVHSAHARFYGPRDIWSIPREVAGICYYAFRSYR